MTTSYSARDWRAAMGDRQIVSNAPADDATTITYTIPDPERVSLHPLAPAEALKALLATPPV